VQAAHADSSAMETDWTTSHQKLKSSSSSSSFNLFDGSGSGPGVDELLSQATDFIANPTNLTLTSI